MGQGSPRWVLALTLLVAQGCTHNLPPPPDSVPKAVVPPPTQNETRALLDSNQFAELERRFSAVQRDYRNGAINDEDLRAAFRVFYATDAVLEQKYTAWITQFPKSYVAHLARGIYYNKVGQERRGGEFIGNTSDEQLRGMQDALAQAAADLRASIELDDKPLLSYSQELDIASYLGNAERSRALLDMAIKVDRGNFIVRAKYMVTLEPRWGGSIEQMYAFLEEAKRAGLSAEHLRLLEGLIIEDQAHTEKEAGDYDAAERDYRKAMALGIEGCLQCYAEVLAERGNAYIEAGKLREGVNDLRAAAEAGNAYAQNELGRYYMLGIPGVLPPDPAVGLAWFKKSADQGLREAQENLDRARKESGSPSGT